MPRGKERCTKFFPFPGGIEAPFNHDIWGWGVVHQRNPMEHVEELAMLSVRNNEQIWGTKYQRRVGLQTIKDTSM